MVCDLTLGLWDYDSSEARWSLPVPLTWGMLVDSSPEISCRVIV